MSIKLKLFGRILAIIISAVISVLLVQQLIRRAYGRLGGKYITLSSDEIASDDAEK